MVQSILRLPKVIEKTGLSRSSIYLMMSKDEFPKPIFLSESGRSVGWLETRIQDWINERIEASRSKAV